jgi:signal transduction protein with GAF and PtsI domain
MAAGEELFPAAAYGYDLGQLRRLGPIAKGAVNATAAAWRSGQVQTVHGEAMSRGAVVAPMLGTERCIGVLAVEVNSDRASDKTTQATVSLVAAQLSAAVAPWPAGSSTEPADILPFERAAGASS